MNFVIFIFVFNLFYYVFPQISSTESPKEILAENVSRKDLPDESLILPENNTKADAFWNTFRKKILELKTKKEIELVILVDGSYSIGPKNFKSEVKFIQKIISDVEVGSKAFRLGVVIYSTKAVIHINHLSISNPSDLEKCSFLHFDIPNIAYPGLNTNTKGALEKAEKILMNARENATKIIFLVTDGFSNLGDPTPIATALKEKNITIYTFGIKNGNKKELFAIASLPTEEHAFLFESFNEFESFARRSLHADLSPGIYAPVKNITFCNYLCPYPGPNGCCSQDATCSCGLISGHFSCLCPPGHYGSGLFADGCTPCPNGTYSEGLFPGDILTCVPCPDINHVTKKYPATSEADCICKERMVSYGEKCKIGFCPQLSPPANGYFVTRNCSNAINAACGVRCFMGHILTGSSVRICNENGTWSGVPPLCQPKTCKPPKPVLNSNIICSDVKYSYMKIDYDNNETYNSTKPEASYRFKRNQNHILINDTSESNFTVGTECFYSCFTGHSLIGSKSRGCLPMLKWSGLKPTCKKIECPALKEILNGRIEPKNCTAKKIKHNFGDVCKFFCDSGYELQGPKFTNCTGKYGIWSEKNNPSRCVDIEPPTIDCPQNFTFTTDENMPYAILNLTLPKTKDNSGKIPILWSKPSFDDNHPLKLRIGVTEIEIYSVDGAGNYGFCSFSIEIKDIEKPKILECQSPPTFYVSEFPPNSTDFKWKEPIFDDNSGVPLSITKNPSVSLFVQGTTSIVYTAMDSSMNTASCSLNITILESPCEERPEESNTTWNCSFSSNNTVKCIVSCPPNFVFADANSTNTLDLECSFTGRKAYWTPDLFQGDIDFFPECSEIQMSAEERTEIVFEGTDKLCHNLESLSYDLDNENEKSENFSIFISCESEIIQDPNESNKSKDLETKEEKYDSEIDTANDLLRTESTNEKEIEKQTIFENESMEPMNSTSIQARTKSDEQENDKIKTLLTSEEVLETLKKITEIFSQKKKQKEEIEVNNNKAEIQIENENLNIKEEGKILEDAKNSKNKFENTETEISVYTWTENYTQSSLEEKTEENIKFEKNKSKGDILEGKNRNGNNSPLEGNERNNEKKGGIENDFDKSIKIKELQDTIGTEEDEKTFENDEMNMENRTNEELEMSKVMENIKKNEVNETRAETEIEEEPKELSEAEKENGNKYLIRSKRKTVQKRAKLRINFPLKSGTSKDLNSTIEILRRFYLKHEDSNPNKTQIPLNISTILICKNGTILKNTFCVKCPRGTFHSVKNSRCEPCPVGHYQEVEGQISCIRCPAGFSTKKPRRKLFKQCKRICLPGTFGRKTLRTTMALSPCTSCPKGSYQPLEGQTSCLNCPSNFTTRSRGAGSFDLCVNETESNIICTNNYCSNGGTCFLNEGIAFCKCPSGFTGSFCEQHFNPCSSSPCYNGGQCRHITFVEYECVCSSGFEGKHCEREKNDCISDPCRGRGECIDLLEGYRCDCHPGYEGHDCSQKISYCEILNPCMNSGTCFDTNGTYTCVCPEGFSGSHCDIVYDCQPETCKFENIVNVVNFDLCYNFTCPLNMKCELLWNRQPTCKCSEGFRGVNCTKQINPNVILKFPKYGVTEYLIADFPDRDFNEISICMWIKTKDDFNYGTLFSYATRNEDNMLTLTDYTGVVLYVSGRYVVTDLQANDDLWHFICVTWQSSNGTWQVYLDGSLFSKGTGLADNVTLPGKGKLVVGQEQDSFGSSFNQVESFAGQMTRFDIWDRILSLSEIKNLFENCENIFGNLIGWPRLLQNIYGEIEEETSLFCTTCNSNLSLAHGQIIYGFNNHVKIATYICNTGFVLKFDFIPNKKTTNYYTRNCMKYGDWDTKEPKCGRVACGFPGHFPRGSISGQSYMYGDKIVYHCSNGYILEGNKTRICLSNGNWSGEAPYCRVYEMECRKLLAPRHGSMFVYINNTKPYNRSVLSQGDRVEFICDKGYTMKGSPVLSCMEGGIWSSEIPFCEGTKCSFPTGKIELVNSSIPKNTLFQENDNLMIKCPTGSQKIITCGKFGTWNLTANVCQYNKCLEEPENPPNGYVLVEKSEKSFEEGEIRHIKCLPGFYLFGDDHITCAANGTWIQKRKSICLKLSCGPPPHPPFPYFISSEEGFNYGDKIYLRCAQGFKSTGEIFIQCQKSGRYSRIKNHCIRISCETPSIPNGYVVKSNAPNFFYGSKIELECSGGKFQPDKYSTYIECQANGNWSTALDCI